MTLADLVSISEFVAALGVIATLIYVGYQIRETREAVRAATAQARTDLGVQLISSRYTSDIAKLLVKSVETPETLSRTDRFKLKSYFNSSLTVQPINLVGKRVSVPSVEFPFCHCSDI